MRSKVIASKVVAIITFKAFLLMSLMSQMTSVEAIEVTKANFTINPPSLPTFYIRSDGSIEPPSAPLRKSGNTYYLTDEVDDFTIRIQKNNIILDGVGKLIRASNIDTEGLMLPVGWHPAIHLEKINNTTIRNLTLQGCYSAIYVEDSKNITITENNAVDNNYGIVMSGSTSVAITKNNITKGSTGIIFYSSSNNTIVENDISSNVEGINFYSASTYDNCVKDNNLTGNIGHAIYFNGGIVNHTITQNNIANNKIGIGNDLPIWNCTIYLNNFIDNSENTQIRIVEGIVAPVWDKDSVGNYWSDYDGSGVYVIDENNIDRYPLSNPVDIYATPNPTPTLTPTLPPEDRNPPHLEPIIYLIPISIIVTVVVLSVLLYRRHRKTANLKGKS